MLSELAQKECVPCKAGAPQLIGSAMRVLFEKLSNGWSIVDDHHLVKEYRFKNFREALDFTNRIGELAESQNHHPDIHLAWGRVQVSIWTHKINGLTESDFILAAKIDALTQNTPIDHGANSA